MNEISNINNTTVFYGTMELIILFEEYVST